MLPSGMETICFVTDRFNKSKVKPNLPLAFWFYKKHILEANAELDPLLRKYKFDSSIPAWKWELFVGILVGDVKKKGNGIDLTEHEVKAYQWKKSPEYQYHKNSWEDKLQEDKDAKHVCVWYKDTPDNIDVYLLHGNEVGPVFESWRPKIHEAYEGENTRDRCRMRLPKDSIMSKGRRILKIRNRKIIEKDLEFFRKTPTHDETESQTA